MNEVGLSEEREKEEEFRAEKQMGFQAEWTYDGKLVNLPLPHPFTSRPRIGVRRIVKGEIGKLIHPIRRELKDSIKLDGRYKAIRLLE